MKRSGSSPRPSQGSARPKVLLIEDDPRLGPATKQTLELDWSVTLVTDVESAFRAVETEVFAVAIVDRRLPDGDGLDFVSWLRGRDNALPVLVLTALGETVDKVEGLDAGSNDYLVKPFEFAELNARLRALTRDYSSGGNGIEIGSWVFFPHNKTLESPYTGRILLTEKEAALLEVLSVQPAVTFSRQQLLTEVFDNSVQEGTVDTYVHYLRRKADTDLIETVRGVGYRLGTPV